MLSVISGCKTNVETETHNHTYSTVWSSDGSYHWHAATCEHAGLVSDRVEHIWNAGQITKEPTDTESGIMTYTCTVCNATKQKTVIKPIGTSMRPSAVGEIIFSDGSVTSSTSLTSAQKAAVVGVVAVKYSDSEFLILAKSYYSGKAWSSSTAGCYNTTPSELENFNDEDGSDNWSYICNADPTYTSSENYKTYYPAFYAAMNYGTDKGLTGKFSTGWYLPSSGELKLLYSNRSSYSSAMTSAGGSLVSVSSKSWMTSGSYAYQVFDTNYRYLISSNGKDNKYYAYASGYSDVNSSIFSDSAKTVSENTYYYSTLNYSKYTYYVVPVYRLKLE